MQINEIWPTYIGISQRDSSECSDHESIYNLLKELESKNLVEDKGGLGFVTDGYIHEHEQLEKLNKWLQEQVYIYADSIGWDIKKEDFFIANSWAVLSKDGASTHNPHIHANSLLSTVYYINAPKGSALLGFINPSYKWESWQPDYKEKTSITEGEYHIPPAAGQCVTFRSNIPHMTGQNMFTDDSQLQERICIAYSWNAKNLGSKTKGIRYGI